jgi:hypothetical protein
MVTFFDKSSHQIHENTSSGSQVASYGQTDGTHDEANKSLFAVLQTLLKLKYNFDVRAFQQEVCSVDLFLTKSSHNWPAHTPALYIRELVHRF